MDVEVLARKAIDKIKTDWGLPQSGFLAGGSLANIVWEFVSGNKAVINDIDIFVLDSVVDKIDQENSIFSVQSKESVISEHEYSGRLNHNVVTNYFYSIIESKREGLLNTILFVSNKDNPKYIIETFDINATQIGYSIENDEVFFTDDFVEFLETGKLKISNISTPSHTALRLMKKRDELGSDFDELEMKIVQFSSHLGDVKFRRFRDKYFEIWEKYSKQLEQYFTINRDESTESFVLEKYSEEIKLWYLQSKIQTSKVFEHDNNIQKIYNSNEFLFYIRKIYGDKELEKVWEKLSLFILDSKNIEWYLDVTPSDEDLELLSKLIIHAPKSAKHLRGLKISEQVDLVKRVMSKFTDRPLVGISILEKHKLAGVDFDDDDLLLLELSVRKESSVDYMKKVSNILGIQTHDDATPGFLSIDFF